VLLDEFYDFTIGWWIDAGDKNAFNTCDFGSIEYVIKIVFVENVGEMAVVVD